MSAVLVYSLTPPQPHARRIPLRLRPREAALGGKPTFAEAMVNEEVAPVLSSSTQSRRSPRGRVQVEVEWAFP